MAVAALRALHGLLPLPRVPFPAACSSRACGRRFAALAAAGGRRTSAMTGQQAGAATAAEREQPAPPLASPALAHSEVLLATSK